MSTQLERIAQKARADRESEVGCPLRGRRARQTLDSADRPLSAGAYLAAHEYQIFDPPCVAIRSLFRINWLG